MSDSVPSGDDDIVEGDAQAFIVGVPNPSQSEFTNYLRLGQASNTDEGYLQEDPSATGSNPPLISSTGPTSPFSNGQLSYTTGNMQLVAPYGYIRLGNSDTPYETWLPTSMKDAGETIQPSNDGSFPYNGVLIYTNDTLQTFARTIRQVTDEATQWIGDNVSIVKNGSEVVQAYRTYGAGGVSSNFQTTAQFNTVLGNITTAITGQNITQWLGNDASTGLGALLWSNFGHTQNVFGGQIVNLINSGIDVQGAFETKISTDITSLASGTITLAADLGALLGPQTTAAAVGSRGALVASVIATVAEAVMDLVTDVTASVDSKSDNAMRTAMDVATGAIAAASTAVVIVQAMAIAAGIQAILAANVAALIAPGIQISDDGVLIQGPGGATRVFVGAATWDATAPMSAIVTAQAAFTVG